MSRVPKWRFGTHQNARSVSVLKHSTFVECLAFPPIEPLSAFFCPLRVGFCDSEKSESLFRVGFEALQVFGVLRSVSVLNNSKFLESFVSDTPLTFPLLLPALCRFCATPIFWSCSFPILRALSRKLSLEQRDWQRYLVDDCQHTWIVCHGAEDAKAQISAFFEAIGK